MSPPSPKGRSLLSYAPEAVRRLAWLFPDDAQARVDEAEAALGRVPWHDDVAVASWVVSEPFNAVVALALLADDPLSLAATRVRAVLPELWGLSAPTEVTTYEHDPGADGGRKTPLLDRTLRAIAAAIDDARALDPSSRALVTAALAFSDVAKGGFPEQVSAWRSRLGIDGTVHNEDSAVIFEDVVKRVLGKAELSDDGLWAERARALCAASGLVGMRLRGEVGRDAFSSFLDVLTRELDGGEKLGRVWSIVNRCDTSAVRKGLWTDALAAAFKNEEQALLMAPASGRGAVRPQLADRIARMRSGVLAARDAVDDVEGALDRLRGARPVLESRLSRCRIWYAEAALGALGLDACVRLLLHLTGAAQAAGVDPTRVWHLDLLGVVGALRDERGEPRRYQLRLLETLLEASSLDDLLKGRLSNGALVSFPATRGGEQALAVAFKTSDEAGALLTLLSIYERKRSAEFHRTLKALCDLYDLRKDDYDRVHNEAAYLSSMNAARSDKQRMLDFVKPGVIVEVGPGGGVVLELLADRFKGSRIVGVDASLAVVEALNAKYPQGEARYETIHGDAFEIGTMFEPGEVTTIVFCSVLHEVFSYVEWPPKGENKRRFCLEAVDAIVAAAYKTLGRGGRIVIRDGVAPKDEPLVLEFVDPVWREGLDLFAKSYEPRKIPFEVIDEKRVRMSAPDIYEFLTTFTWGPDSFPYEIREQRAVLPRAEYVARLLDVCKAADANADPASVPVPDDLASYLQPGYPEHIAPHVRILDAAGEKEVRMPDVNGVWVIEKR